MRWRILIFMAQLPELTRHGYDVCTLCEQFDAMLASRSAPRLACQAPTVTCMLGHATGSVAKWQLLHELTGDQSTFEQMFFG